MLRNTPLLPFAQFFGMKWIGFCRNIEDEEYRLGRVWSVNFLVLIGRPNSLRVFAKSSRGDRLSVVRTFGSTRGVS